MIWLLSTILLLGVLALPAAFGLAVLWRVACPRMPASDALLAGLVCLPILLVLEVVGLGSAPGSRPLDHTLLLHCGVLGVLAVSAWIWRVETSRLIDDLRRGAAAAARSSGFVVTAMLCAGLAIQIGATLYGGYCVPQAIDVLAYHLPQALQPFQDGRLGVVHGNRLWIDAYPRGAALVYSWTMLMTSSDVGLNVTNAASGFVLMLASYVLARRLGLGVRFALLAAAVVPSAPIVFCLSTSGYIDLFMGAMIASAVAFAVPARDGSWGWGSVTACLLALVMALWMKFTAVVPTGVILGLRGIWAIAAWRLRDGRGVQVPGLLSLAAAAVIALAVGSIPYIRTTATYGTPTFPMQLRVGPVVVFEGPIDTSHFGRDNHLPPLQRFAAYWGGWYEPLSPDSRGSLGPLFVMAIMPAMLVLGAGVLLGWRHVSFGWGLTVAVFWMVWITPEHHIPRYGVYVIGLGAVACAGLARALKDSSLPARASGGEGAQASPLPARLDDAWILGLAGLFAWNAHVISVDVRKGVDWYLSTGVPLLTERRNGEIRDMYVRLNTHSPSRSTLSSVHALMQPGELLVTSVDGLMGMFYDWRYSFRVEHRPAQAWPSAFNGHENLDHGLNLIDEWLAARQQDGTAAVMVYRGSVEDRALSAPGSGFTLHYEQPPEEGTVIRVYRRTTPAGTGPRAGRASPF